MTQKRNPLKTVRPRWIVAYAKRYASVDQKVKPKFGPWKPYAQR